MDQPRHASTLFIQSSEQGGRTGEAISELGVTLETPAWCFHGSYIQDECLTERMAEHLFPALKQQSTLDLGSCRLDLNAFVAANDGVAISRQQAGPSLAFEVSKSQVSNMSEHAFPTVNKEHSDSWSSEHEAREQLYDEEEFSNSVMHKNVWLTSAGLSPTLDTRERGHDLLQGPTGPLIGLISNEEEDCELILLEEPGEVQKDITKPSSNDALEVVEPVPKKRKSREDAIKDIMAAFGHVQGQIHQQMNHLEEVKNQLLVKEQQSTHQLCCPEITVDTCPSNPRSLEEFVTEEEAAVGESNSPPALEGPRKKLRESLSSSIFQASFDSSSDEVDSIPEEIEVEETSLESSSSSYTVPDAAKSLSTSQFDTEQPSTESASNEAKSLPTSNSEKLSRDSPWMNDTRSIAKGIVQEVLEKALQKLSAIHKVQGGILLSGKVSEGMINFFYFFYSHTMTVSCPRWLNLRLLNAPRHTNSTVR
jgi:hypothetical protein